jgi:conjugal transfer ATP-binding protein TraC
MSALRQFRGARASALFAVLAFAAEEGVFLLDDQSLGFGYLCEPLAAGDQGQAERLSVLLNQDWPKDTLLQVMLWASPDIEEPLARMGGCGSAMLTRCCARRPPRARSSCTTAPRRRSGPGPSFGCAICRSW